MTQSKDEDFTFDISITDDYIIDSDTITINMNDYLSDNIDISNITTSTVDTTGFDNLIAMDDITLTINDYNPVEFEDHMPSVAKVEDMCNDYPALAQAYEKFKTIYAMVHQDWQGRQDENEVPF